MGSFALLETFTTQQFIQKTTFVFFDDAKSKMWMNSFHHFLSKYPAGVLIPMNQGEDILHVKCLGQTLSPSSRQHRHFHCVTLSCTMGLSLRQPLVRWDFRYVNLLCGTFTGLQRTRICILADSCHCSE